MKVGCVAVHAAMNATPFLTSDETAGALAGGSAALADAPRPSTSERLTGTWRGRSVRQSVQSVPQSHRMRTALFLIAAAIRATASAPWGACSTPRSPPSSHTPSCALAHVSEHRVSAAARRFRIRLRSHARRRLSSGVGRVMARQSLFGARSSCHVDADTWRGRAAGASSRTLGGVVPQLR